MPTDLDLAFDFTMTQEVPDPAHPLEDNPADPGGLTKWGVASKFWPPHRLERVVGKRDLREITREDAKTIFRVSYWEPTKCGLFPWPVNLALSDFAYNCGVPIASKSLQRAAGLTGDDVDGKIGPMTRAAAADAIKTAGPVGFALALGLERRRWYAQRLIDDPKMAVWLDTWVLRTRAAEKLAKKPR